MASIINIPISDDLAIYARLVQSFLARRSVQNFALLVLSQRVLVERVRSQRKADRRAEVYSEIKKINTDPVYRAKMAAGVDAGSALAKVYPRYVQAGLIDS